MDGPDLTAGRRLGHFTSSELRLGGIGERGFLQPLMAPRPGAAITPAGDVVAALARRGLMLHSGEGWRPVGRFLDLLEAAAAARSLVACPPADPRSAVPPSPEVMGPDRILLGRLGATDLVLDLLPGAGGYDARLVPVEDLLGDLIDWCDLGGLPAGGDPRPPLAQGGPEWAAAESDGTFSRALPPVVETAAVISPDGPLLQQRLTIFDTTPGDPPRWIGLGVAEGAPLGRWAAPAGPDRVRRVLSQALRGERIRL